MGIRRANRERGHESLKVEDGPVGPRLLFRPAAVTPAPTKSYPPGTLVDDLSV